ncbi:MAG: substrate-binding domain-containing protein [Bacteroidia bacterium]|nr:substrate-binding domain-containing protein [Bacteroidia bacterium]
MKTYSETASILSAIKISEHSDVPKYLQLVYSVKDLILRGKIHIGDQLPSVNEASFEYYLARDTIVKAYNLLKEQGIIKAVPGKGYFIARNDVRNRFRIFLLFNKLSAHKKIIYDAFVMRLGEQASIDFYVYHNDFKVFRYLIEEHLADDYHYFVIIPHFEQDKEKAHEIINRIPPEKRILLDNKIEGICGKYASVYQNFQKDIYQSLTEAGDILGKYTTLKLVFPHGSYHSEDIVRGFRQFCIHQGYRHQVLGEVRLTDLEEGTAFVVIKDEDLVQLIKYLRQTEFKAGENLGIISYNETPLKEVLLDGITVMSTDFARLGETAADMILNNRSDHIENPFRLIRRKSL